MSDSYEVGIIGCGWMGEAHAQTFAKVPEFEVVAAADFDEDSLTQLADDYDVAGTYESHAEMLAEESLDVVSICTWHGTHANLTIDACEAGVSGVLCEKPMATNMGEVRDMLDAADRNDVALTIAHQRRYTPVHERVQEVIGDGAVGEPQVVRTGHGHGLLNWGTHLIDLGRYFLGDPDPVWVAGHVERETDRYERGQPIEDRCVGVIAFEGGARLVIEQDVPGPDATENLLQLYGSRGVMDLDLGRSATVTSPDGIDEYAPEADREDRLPLVEEFVELMEGDRTDHRCSGDAAARTMEIMMGLYESVRTHQLVELPVQTRDNPLEVLIDEDLPPTYPGRYDIRIPYESVRDR